MFIPGPKLNTVFASRWKALAWAGGVLLTAYCSVPAADKASDQAEAHKAAARKVPPPNPWALDPK